MDTLFAGTRTDDEMVCFTYRKVYAGVFQFFNNGFIMRGLEAGASFFGKLKLEDALHLDISIIPL